MGVALAAIADNRDSFAAQTIQITVLFIIDVSHFIVPPKNLIKIIYVTAKHGCTLF